MAVRANFYVAEIKKYATAAGTGTHGYAEPVPYGEITMRATKRTAEDNIDWASATPAGELKMTVNGPAFPWFESMLGKNILITMEEYPDA